MSSQQEPDRLAKLIEYMARYSGTSNFEVKTYRLEDIISYAAHLGRNGWDVKQAITDMNGDLSSFDRPYDINTFLAQLTDEEIFRSETNELEVVDSRLSDKFMNANLSKALQSIQQHTKRELDAMEAGNTAELTVPDIVRDW